MSSDREALVKKYGEPTVATLLNPEDVAAAIVYALIKGQSAHAIVNEITLRHEPADPTQQSCPQQSS
jgi:NADP-dependent 3-hydroxy acid dehydrogenase YdfG